MSDIAIGSGRFRLGQMVAGGLFFFIAGLGRADPLDFVERGFQMLAGDDQHRDVMAFLDIVDGRPLFVQQVGRGIDGQVGDHLAGVLLDRFFLDDAQHRQGQRFDAANAALAAAARAG